MPTRGDTVRAHLALRNPAKWQRVPDPDDAATADVTIARTAPTPQQRAHAAAVAKGPSTALVEPKPQAAKAAAPAKADAPYAVGEGRKAATEIIQAAVSKLRKERPGVFTEASAWAWLLDNDRHAQETYERGELAEMLARRPKRAPSDS